MRATTINMEMKIAAAHALAKLAREDVPDEVAAAYGARPKSGPEYIIPVPFDPRLISTVPPAVPRRQWTQRCPQARCWTWMPIVRNCARGATVAGVLQRVFGGCAARPNASSSLKARKSR